MPKRLTPDDRRHAREAALRRVLSLVEVYAEMCESWLIAETYDAEFVRRMVALRETTLALVEAAMPLPLDTAELDEVRTESRAIH
jgi:hypothetical protein